MELVWSAITEDEVWAIDCELVEENPYRATLIVTRVADQKEILREEITNTSGTNEPEQHDVNLWGHMVLGAIDHYAAQHPKENA